MTELKVQKLLGHILSVLALTMSSKGDQCNLWLQKRVVVRTFLAATRVSMRQLIWW
ncbi:hypothetical protein HanIR_Chr13g0628811 [Helianthus annuus]|nr:hypothetical protein HanIR_Chr13g0628811 [Helianthus annuus]